jgi:hypothetical protein
VCIVPSRAPTRHSQLDRPARQSSWQLPASLLLAHNSTCRRNSSDKAAGLRRGQRNRRLSVPSPPPATNPSATQVKSQGFSQSGSMHWFEPRGAPIFTVLFANPAAMRVPRRTLLASGRAGAGSERTPAGRSRATRAEGGLSDAASRGACQPIEPCQSRLRADPKTWRSAPPLAGLAYCASRACAWAKSPANSTRSLSD